jgi:hypothetical protein
MLEPSTRLLSVVNTTGIPHVPTESRDSALTCRGAVSVTSSEESEWPGWVGDDGTSGDGAHVRNTNCDVLQEASYNIVSR